MSATVKAPPDFVDFVAAIVRSFPFPPVVVETGVGEGTITQAYRRMAHVDSILIENEFNGFDGCPYPHDTDLSIQAVNAADVVILDSLPLETREAEARMVTEHARRGCIMLLHDADIFDPHSLVDGVMMHGIRPWFVWQPGSYSIRCAPTLDWKKV